MTALAEPALAAPPTRDDPPAPVRRLRVGAGALALVAMAFSQAPGMLVGDTKSDLVLDPGRFLHRALLAWDPGQAFGQLANQSYGYLWPMGPFFWLGHAVGLPGWVVQRSWWALLLVVGYAGVLRLAGVLRIGTPPARLVAALAYAASPRVLSVLGTISVEAWPAAVLPWVLLPLVRGAAGELTARRAAARSGLAVLCLGGVNATATAAVLPLPALYLLTRRRGVRGRLLAWWLPVTVLASAWWALPLLVLGRYGYPFLDLIETARVTTSVATLTDALRGGAHWLGYLLVGGWPAWTAGWQLATSPTLVAATALLAAAGLAGLLLPGLADRRWLGAGVLLGTGMVAAGHTGVLTGPLAPAVQHALDGPLAALRNVHKADPLLRLPLALGLAHLLAVAAGARWWPAAGWRLPAGWRPRGTPGTAAIAGVAAVLAVTVSPAWDGLLAPAGAYLRTPAYWQDVAGWLAGHSGGRRALLLPSANAPVYRWGTPRDEPLQALARSPWAVRDAVPLGAPGSIRLLDGLDARLATGQPSAAYAPVLARAGVRYVVLRNDLDPDRSGAERPAVVRAALAGSPGLRRVAAFGPEQPAPYRFGDRPVGAAAALPRAVEVFAVAGGADPVLVYPRAGALAVSGGPEAALGLADAGLLAGRAVVGGTDPAAAATAAVVRTDTLRRRALNTGAGPGGRYSATLGASDPVPRPDVGVEGGAFPGWGGQSVAVLEGVAGVTASSRADDPFAADRLGPDRRPAAAVDGDPTTAWLSAGRTVGEWVELRLSRPARPTAVTVTPLADPALGPAVTEIAVSTDAGTVHAPVTDGRPVPVALPAGATSRVRVTITAVTGRRGSGAVGVRELSVPGVTVTEAVALPAGAVTPPGRWTVLVGRPDGRRGDCVREDAGWVCLPGLAAAGEETGPLERRFDAPAGRIAVSATVRPRPGAALDALLDGAAGYRAAGSSRLADDPAARPGAAYDGEPATAWLVGRGDSTPQLSLDLKSTSELTGLRLSGRPVNYAGVRAVVLSTPDGQRRTLSARPGRTQRFAPVRTDRITLTFQRRVGSDGVLRRLVVRDVTLTGAPARRTGPVEVGCPAGPAVVLDGAVRRLAVLARASDLLSLAPVRAAVCGGRVPVRAGPHRLSSTAVPALEVAAARLTAGAVPAVPAGRAVTATRWSAEHRTLRVAAGADGYLALAEGFNAGWRATTGGHELTPVRLDGWRQGWLLPAGGQTEVELAYGPGRIQRALMVAGLLAALAVVGLALLPGRHRTPAVPAAPHGRRWRQVMRLPLRRRRRGTDVGRWPAAGAVLAVGVLLVGWAGLAAGAAALLLPRRWRAAGAGGLAAGAGLVRAAAAGPVWARGAAQLLAAASLCLLAAALAGWRPPGEPVRQPQRGPLDQFPGRGPGGDGAGGGEQGDREHPAAEVGEPGDPVDRVQDHQVPQEDPVRDPPQPPQRC